MLKNFRGMGLQSNERLITYIFKDDLSLNATFLQRDKEIIYEIKLTEGVSFLGTQTTVFNYKKANSKGITQTEVFSEDPVVNLLSAFVIVSNIVARGEYHTKNFNLLLDDVTRIVEIAHHGREYIVFQGQDVPTEILSLQYKGREFMRFHIHKDSSGYYFLVQVLIDDEGNSLELRADMIAH
jgi:hypothetical protein